MERLANHLFDWSLRLLGLGVVILLFSIPATLFDQPSGRLYALAGCSAIVLAAALYTILAIAFVVGIIWALVTE